MKGFISHRQKSNSRFGKSHPRWPAAPGPSPTQPCHVVRELHPEGGTPRIAVTRTPQPSLSICRSLFGGHSASCVKGQWRNSGAVSSNARAPSAAACRAARARREDLRPQRVHTGQDWISSSPVASAQRVRAASQPRPDQRRPYLTTTSVECGDVSRAQRQLRETMPRAKERG